MNRQRLINSLRNHEGYRAAPYQDHLGYWTIGIGTCLERKPITAAQWRHLLDEQQITLSLTEAGSKYLLESEVDEIIRKLSLLIAAWDALDSVRQEVLTEMAYQLGVDGLLRFRRMLAAVERGNWQMAAAEGLNSKWHEQTPRRAEELMRRLKEGEQRPK